MQTTTQTVTTVDGPMALYEAVPDEGNGGGVVVVQEAFGLNEHIEDVTRRFAAEGYHAVAPTVFHRAGGGTATYDDFNQVFPLFAGLDDAGILMDVDAAVAHLVAAGIPTERIGVVGFCMGGRASFLTAVSRTLGAAVGFYGGGIVRSQGGPFPALIDQAPALATPWLGLFGDLDGSIPVEDVETLRAALADVATPTEIVRYADAEHGFHADPRPSYHEAAATDAWARTLAFFATHLV